MLEPQLKRGMLETCILAALCRGDSYGYQIIKELPSGISISESTLYPILRRLEAAGCLTVYSVEHSGRLRKFYRITPSGRSQIADFLESWQEMETMVRYIREGYERDEG